MAFCCTSQKRRGLTSWVAMARVDRNHVRNAVVLRKKVLREISLEITSPVKNRLKEHRF